MSGPDSVEPTTALPGNLAAKFLSLYECLTYPEHTELLIQTLGDWLAEEDAPLTIVTLERHSETVLALAADLLAQRKSEPEPDAEAVFDCALPAAAHLGVEGIEDALGVDIPADDFAALRHWMNEPEEVRLFRAIGKDGRGRLAIARKTVTGDGRLSIWLSDPTLARTSESLLERDLGMSGSEILVLREIAAGRRRSEIARLLGKSEETIKTQIRSIANKMGVSGQMEIAAELRGIERVLPARPNAPLQPTAGNGQMRLPDGRILEYLEFGPPDGVPILFVHCFLHGKNLPRTIEPALAASGHRIVSMSRAGYGNSTLRTGGHGTLLQDSARDYVQLATHLNLGRCHLLAHATGFATAFCFANLYPELTRRLIGLDAVPPVNRTSDSRALQGLFRAAAVTMLKAPSTFALMTRFAMHRLATFNDADKTLRRHILYPSVELESIETPEGITAGTANVREMMVNDLKECIQEAQVFRQDWSALGSAANTRPETHLFHTAGNPFVSLEGSLALARSLECNLTELGETFPFLAPHLPVILARLA